MPTPKDNVDVIVIGSGAGGGVIAKELAEAGLELIVLEAGRRFDPHKDYPTNTMDFEVRAGDVFSPKDPRRDLYTSGGSHPFLYFRVKGVGGATLHYHAMSPRLLESDFRVRSEDGVADDWPISYADLEPYYTKVEYELGVSGPDGEGANPFDPPRSRPYPTPAHEFNHASRVMKRGTDKLGLHLVREPLAIPTKDWNGRPACINAGTCRMGCKIAAKSSIDVTYIPKAENTGKVQIRTECMAHKITTGPDGRARSVIYFDPDGREMEIFARVIVVAGNAVETPRLLLLSSSPLFPDGLANSSGLVGKRFTEHLSMFAHGVFPERLDPWRGVPTGGIIHDFYATNSRNNFVRGWTISVENDGQWPLTTARNVPGWGAGHKARVEQRFGHVMGLDTSGEQLPDEHNQVRLDPAVKDIYGLPVPLLINNHGQNDVAMGRAISSTLRNILEAAGAAEIHVGELMFGGSSHYLGTCRMGHDPRTSVVDSLGRSHDVPNLFVGDGSVFVTVGAANPALTISALANRTADGIIESFRRGDFQ
ncbi:MAG: GMC family oxidoreductase [Candidatus Acidiferrales bacterium]